MIHEELSGKIIGAAMDVLNELRPGLDEKLYERAMIIELKDRGHSLSIQKAFPVFYRSELLGNLISDLIVDDAVIVDPKVVACKNARLEWKRVLRPREPGEHDTPDLHA